MSRLTRIVMRMHAWQAFRKRVATRADKRLADQGIRETRYTLIREFSNDSCA